jgi:ribose transport system ATP-binding protein
MSPATLLNLRNIRKQYPGVLALNDVSFDLEAGEIHCLVGENGAGKSTLMGILSGATSKDAGEILLDGRTASISSPAQAQALGIAMMYQDFKLVPELTVAENIFLGREPLRSGFIDAAAMLVASRTLIERLGENIDAATPVKQLNSAQKQIIEIAKALSRNIRVLVLDEPTAALTDSEKDRLFDILRGLKEQGTGIIYISHRLEEIFEIGDRITVMRDGAVVHTEDVATTNVNDVIKRMVGREITDQYPARIRAIGETVVALSQVDAQGLSDITFELRRGEVLGVAGLIGSGKRELSRLLFGDNPVSRGEIRLGARALDVRSPREAIAAGIGLLTEDRNLLGLFLNMNIRENISISNLGSLSRNGLIDSAADRATANGYLDLLRIKAPSSETLVQQLSGGNRQKVILARWLQTHSDVMIFNEPTAGVDVGAKYEIYTVINELVSQGKSVLLMSSELPELLGMCDRILVLCQGKVTGILDIGEATQEKIMRLATQFGAVA